MLRTGANSGRSGLCPDVTGNRVNAVAGRDTGRPFRRIPRLFAVALLFLGLHGLPGHAQNFAGYGEYYVLGDEADIFTALEAAWEDGTTAGTVLSVVSIVASANGVQVYLDRADRDVTASGGTCASPPCYNFDPNNPGATADAKWDVDGANYGLGGYNNEEGGALALGDVLNLCNDPVDDDDDDLEPSVGCAYGSQVAGEAVVGGDRLYITGAPVSITRTTFAEDPGPFLAGTWELYSTTAWDDAYTVPVGVDITEGNPASQTPFQYTYLFVEAARDDTAICVDGVYETTLDQGGNWSEGSIESGTRITAFHDPLNSQDCSATTLDGAPIQAALLTSSGDNISARYYTLTPEAALTNDYYLPTPSHVFPDNDGGFDNDYDGRQLDTAAYIYSFQDNTNVIIEYGDGGTGSSFINVTLDEGDVYRFVMPRLPDAATQGGHYGAYVTTDDNSDKIWVLVAGDDEVDLGTGVDGDVVDWGYQAVDAAKLDSEYFLPFAPANPLHITPVADNTTIFADWDNDGTADASVTLDRLDTYRMFPANPDFSPPAADYYNGTGARIYSDSPFAIAWGQDNSQYTNGEQGYFSGTTEDLDFGYTVLPANFFNSADPVLGIDKSVSPSSFATGVSGAAGQVTYTLEVSAASSSLLNVDVCDRLPTFNGGMTYVAGSSVITLPDGTVITDGVTDTDPGSSAAVCGTASALFWDMSSIAGSDPFPMAAGEKLTIRFNAQPTNPYVDGFYTNTGEAVGTGPNGQVFRPRDRAIVTASGLLITKTSSAIGALIPGQIVDYTVVVTNDTGETQTDVAVSDTLPSGVTYVDQSTVVNAPRVGATESQEITENWNSGGFTGGNSDTVLQWSGNWSRSSTSNVVIDDGEARMRNGSSLWRSIDLGAASAPVTLSFSAREEGSHDSNDIVTVEICEPGPSNCTTLWSEDDDFSSTSPSVAIPGAYFIDGAVLRIRLNFYGGSGEFFYIDDISIAATIDATDTDVTLDNVPGGNNDLFNGDPCCLLTTADGVSMGDGESVTIRYRVVVDDDLPAGVDSLTNVARATTAEAGPVLASTTNTLAPGSIGNRVWLDFDGDGLQDANEDGIAGVEVELLSAGGDSIDSDSSTPGIQPTTTITGPNGEYLFSGLVPGTYRVRVNDGNSPSISGLNATYDEDGGTASPDNDSGPIELSSNEEHLTADFGYGPLPAGGGLGDYVWLDADDDGVQDAGEVGISGVTVALYATGTVTVGGTTYTAGEQIATTTTDARGRYLFENLPPDDYRVVVNPDGGGDGQSPAGFVNGTAAGSDPDGAIDNETVVRVSAGEYDLSADFGYRLGGALPAGLSIGNQVFTDANTNGVFDGGDTGIEGVTVLLFAGSDTTGTPLATTVTDADGEYLFTGLSPAEYTVLVVENGAGGVRLASQTSDPADGVDNGEACAGSCALFNTVTLSAGGGGGTQTMSDDMNDLTGGTSDDDIGWVGNWQTTGTVSNYGDVASLRDNATLWREMNLGAATTPATLSFDASELNGLESSDVVVVEVCTDDGFGTCQTLWTASDDFGSASPTVNIPDAYLLDDAVLRVRLSGYSGTSGSSNPFDWEWFSIDNIVIEATIPAAATSNLFQDFGFVTTSLPVAGNVGDRVWLDTNGDGVQDAGESGIAGVRVQLRDDGGNVVATTYTGTGGEYLFTGVTTGADYRVTVDATTLPPGLQPSYDEDDWTFRPDGDSGLFTLEAGESHLTADFGYTPSTGGAIGTIGDYVWVDADGDGQQDPGESGMAGVTVGLYAAEALSVGGTDYAAGEVISTTTTNDAGLYLFTGLPAGAYRVLVEPSGGTGNAPSGYIAHDAGDPDVRDGTSSNGVADNETTVYLSAGEANLDADFGYRFASGPASGQSIGNLVFSDVNGNGTFDGGDAGIPGVTVTLFNDSGSPVATTITNAAGEYQFTGLANGDYTVLVTDGSNVLQNLVQTAQPGGTDGGVACAPCSDSSAVTLSGSGNQLQDFGFRYQTQGGGTGVIGDTVFLDTNGNGTPQANEGVEGVLVVLYDAGQDGTIGTSDDRVLDVELTDENGRYLFSGLPLGEDYRVVVDTSSLPGGGIGWQNTVDPDGGADAQSTVTNLAGRDLAQDFGFAYSGIAAAIEGTVWQDDDGDGVIDGDEPDRFEGVTVLLKDGNGNIVQTILTDADGNYAFTDLPAGTYRVEVTDDDNVLSSFEHTCPAEECAESDADAEPDGDADSESKDDTGFEVTVAAGETVTYADFGYEPVVTNPVSLAWFRTIPGPNEGDVRFEWMTSMETGNLLFEIYAKDRYGEWHKVTTTASTVVNSDLPTAYALDLGGVPGDLFAIVDVDVTGQRVIRGPFALGQEYGVRRDHGDAGSGAIRPVTPGHDTDTAIESLNRRIEGLLDGEELRERREAPTQPQNGDVETGWMDTLGARAREVLFAGVLSALAPAAHALEAMAQFAPLTGVEVADWSQALNRHEQDSGEALLLFTVEKEGVHRVTYEQLLDLGIDLGGVRTRRLSLTHRGVPVPVTVEGAERYRNRSLRDRWRYGFDRDDDYFGPGGYIEFIGVPADATQAALYDQKAIYVLHLDARERPRAAVDNSRPRGASVSLFEETLVRNENRYYSVTSTTADPFVEAAIVAVGGPASHETHFELPDHAVGHGSVRVAVEVSGAMDFPGDLPDHHVTLEVNGTALALDDGDGRFDGMVPYTLEAVIPDSVLVDGENTLTLRLPLDVGQVVDFVYFDRWAITYPRELTPKPGRQLVFDSDQYAFEMRFNGVVDDLIIYRVTPGGTVSRIERIEEGWGCQRWLRSACGLEFAGAGRGSRYYVASQDSLLMPFVSVARPGQDVTAGAAEYLVIAHPDFIDAPGNPLGRLLTARLGTFSTARIVDIRDVYAQFGGHMVSPDAIRAFIAYADAHLDTSHVLLVGGSSTDPNNLAGRRATRALFLPMFFEKTSEIIFHAPTDAPFADADGDGVPEVAIGRMPVRSIEELTAVVDKTLTYADRSYTGTSVFAADFFDAGNAYDFRSDSERMIASLPAAWNAPDALARVYLDDYGEVGAARADLVDAINSGVSLVSFAGHSDLQTWTFDGLFSSVDASALQNAGQPTVVTQWGCWNSNIVGTAPSIGETLILGEDRGAAAVLGSTTLTQASRERVLAQLLYELLAEPDITLGVAMTEAKQRYFEEYGFDGDVLLGWTILGDPALTIE